MPVRLTVVAVRSGLIIAAEAVVKNEVAAPLSRVCTILLQPQNYGLYWSLMHEWTNQCYWEMYVDNQ